MRALPFNIVFLSLSGDVRGGLHGGVRLRHDQLGRIQLRGAARIPFHGRHLQGPSIKNVCKIMVFLTPPSPCPYLGLSADIICGWSHSVVMGIGVSYGIWDAIQCHLWFENFGLSNERSRF